MYLFFSVVVNCSVQFAAWFNCNVYMNVFIETAINRAVRGAYALKHLLKCFSELEYEEISEIRSLARMAQFFIFIDSHQGYFALASNFLLTTFGRHLIIHAWNSINLSKIEYPLKG